MIIQTVALPIYNSKQIAWLAMEGLCNQIDIDYKWELIICEERHKQQLGNAFFQSYAERLKNIGCDRIKYIELKGWIPLAEKWRVMGKEASATSESFLLQAADCYPFRTRLKEANYYINEKAYDWIDYNRGYFYSFDFKNIILYSFDGKTNLNMAFKTKYARKIKESARKKGVDSFLLDNALEIKQFKPLTITKQIVTGGLDTDGFNNISTKRKRAFRKNRCRAFQRTNLRLKDLAIPNYIKQKLHELS